MTTLIDAVQNALKADTEFMELLGLTPAATGEQMTARFTKGMEPDIVISAATMPHVCQYTQAGRFGPNPLVYEGKFTLDFYAKSAAAARAFGERAFQVLHDKRISSPGFASFLCVLSFDTDAATGIKDVKMFRAFYDVDYLRMN